MLINLKNRQIVGLDMPEVVAINNGFLFNNQTLVKFRAMNMVSFGTCFLYNNNILTNFYAPLFPLKDRAPRFLAFNKNINNPDFYAN
jgi:hypothetical protein